jgi:hypothetical protein
MTEEMPGGVCDVTVQYCCSSCRNASEHYNSCNVYQMLPLMLLMTGHTSCPFRNKTAKQIEELLDEIKQSKENGQ